MNEIRDPTGLNEADLPVRFGRYELHRVLGAGGSGRVFRAVLVGPAGFRKDVAVKVLRRNQGAGLAQEARIGGLLKHPNVVETYELGEVDGATFVAMELVDGISLAGLMNRAGVLSPRAALDVAEQAAAGLAHAHALDGGPRRLVHRDVTPRNILLDGLGVVKLADFGIAAVLTEGVPAPVRGTPEYMSPEQVTGQALDPRSDLFALGAVVYEMVTGEGLFGRRSELAPDPTPVLRAILDVDRVIAHTASMQTVERRVPGLAAVLRRCLARDPGLRYRSAGELGAALRAVRSGLPAGPGLDALLRSHGIVARGASMLLPLGHPSSSVGARTNLAVESDRFFGRQTELRRLGARLAEARLVTLKGPGGAGKTRLVRRLGSESLPSWPGGVWFCDLSAVRTLPGLLTTVASALDVSVRGVETGSGVEQIGRALAGRGRALVVLDNFEQIVDLADRTVARWLPVAAEVRFLVTSRVRLRLRGEVVVELGPLDEQAAVDLFQERAEARGLEASADREALAWRIVRKLDGMPLAIELAAARSGGMSPQTLLARLDDRFAVLRDADDEIEPPSGVALTSSGSWDRRQATLRNTLDWSWGLLAPWEREAVAQLSVFHGGFALEDAEAVLDLNAWPDAPWALDVVESLLDQSWLVTRNGAGAPRFGMYASILEYGRQRLDATGDRLAVEVRHARAMAHLGPPGVLWQVFGPGGPALLDRLDAELDNLVAALEVALAQGALTLSVACWRGAATAIERRGPYAGALAFADALLGAPLAAGDRATVLELVGRLWWRSGRGPRAAEVLSEARAAWAVVGDRRGEGRTAAVLGACLHDTGGQPHDAVIALLEEAVELGRQVGDVRTQGVALSWLASALREVNRSSEAFWKLDAALPLLRESGDRREEAYALSDLALVWSDPEGRDRSLAMCEEALDLARSTHDRWTVSRVLNKLGAMYRMRGRLDDAIEADGEALALCRESGDAVGEGISQESLGASYLLQGRVEEADVAVAAGLALREGVGDRLGVVVMLLEQAGVRVAQVRLDEAEEVLNRALAIGDELGLARLAVSARTELAALGLRRAELDAAEAWLGSVPEGHRGLSWQALSARVAARRGRVADARATLEHLRDQNLGMVRAIGVLLDAADVEQVAGADAARDVLLAEAEVLLERLGVRETSMLAREAARLRGG